MALGTALASNRVSVSTASSVIGSENHEKSQAFHNCVPTVRMMPFKQNSTRTFPICSSGSNKTPQFRIGLPPHPQSLSPKFKTVHDLRKQTLCPKEGMGVRGNSALECGSLRHGQEDTDGLPLPRLLSRGCYFQVAAVEPL